MIVLLFSLNLTLLALTIIQKPIDFSIQRIALTKAYVKEHYDIQLQNITMQPRMIVLHYTALDDFNKSFERFKSPYLPNDRPDIAKAGQLNVSTHYLVDRDGTIYQLMPDNWIARHVIGLNFSAIGIENVGGESGVFNLTKAQEKANIALIKYLQSKYTTIKYLIGHSEYRCFENSLLWLEKNKNYRTKKHDPGKQFLFNVFKNSINLLPAPCEHQL